MDPTIRKHRFSAETLARVRECYRNDDWHGPLEVAEHWLVVAGAVALSLWSWSHLPLALSIPVYCAAIFLVGGRQRALAGVLHMACHGALTRNPRLGRILATYFSGYPVLQSYTGYMASHVVAHHGNFGHPERDPDYVQYQRAGLCGENLGRASLRRHLLRLTSPRSTASYVAYLVRNRISNPDEKRWETWLRVVYLLALLGAAAACGWLWIVAAYWLVPQVTTQVWIGSVAELLEHYPLIESAPRVDIHMTRNRECGRWSDFVLGEQRGEGYHLVHHLFPRVPIWRLREAHAILMSDETYAALYQPGGWYYLIRGIFAALPEPRTEA